MTKLREAVLLEMRLRGLSPRTKNGRPHLPAGSRNAGKTAMKMNARNPNPNPEKPAAPGDAGLCFMRSSSSHEYHLSASRDTTLYICFGIAGECGCHGTLALIITSEHVAVIPHVNHPCRTDDSRPNWTMAESVERPILERLLP